MRMQITRMLIGAIAPMRRRLGFMISKGIVTLVDPDTLLQTLQMTLNSGEVIDNISHFEPYGFTSHPLKGLEGVVLFPHGDRQHGLCIQVGGRNYRLQGLAEGEVALSTDEGDVIHLKRGNKILINSASHVEIVAATKITLNGEAGKVVTTMSTCAYTGGPHPDGLDKVKAG